MTDDRKVFLDELVLKTRRLSPAPPAPEQGEDKLEQIREHLIRPWDQLVRVAGRELNARFAGLSGAEMERLSVLRSAPSLLVPLGLVKDECTHTRLLAWILSQQDATGRGCRQAWRRLCVLAADGSTEGWQVKAEHRLGPHGRVDLTVVTSEADVIFVEAKVHHRVGLDQLQRYYQALSERPESGHKTLVLLTLDGRRGAPDVPHLALGFRDVIAAFLPHAVGEGTTVLFLSMWLASLARDLLRDLSEDSPSSWTLGQRRRTLELLVADGAPHA